MPLGNLLIIGIPSLGSLDFLLVFNDLAIVFHWTLYSLFQIVSGVTGAKQSPTRGITPLSSNEINGPSFCFTYETMG